ncbi:hypothetical protein ACFE04_003735 [Oxalis oulophora]
MPPPNLFRLHLLRPLSTTTAAAASASPITISKIRSELDHDKALQLYSSISKTKPSRHALELTVRRLSTSRRTDDVISLIDSHKADPRVKTDEHFVSSLIRCYGFAGMSDHALGLYTQMDEFGTPRTVYSFNVVLNAFVRSKCCRKVPTLFTELSDKYGIVPDKVSYGILVKSYCELCLVEKAVEVLELMKAKNVEVTASTYSMIMDSFYKKGKGDEAERLWTEMSKNGCELDTAAYNVRIVNAGKDVVRVQELINEMATFGLKPDTCSYNALIRCYFKEGNLEEAKKVYKGLVPNAATFRIMILHLCRKEEYEDAYNVFRDSVKANKIPAFGMLRPLAVGLVKQKKLNEANEFFCTLKKKFNPSLMNAWKKVEISLGLVSEDGGVALA